MSREYIAFISYRHLPLDRLIAKRLHRRIEHWLLPKEQRQNGRKNLGIVFRDQDELPLSSNLTQSIYDALDHSKYLIVICTPDTPNSVWVDREIEYFLETHSRDNVLIVLADGTPEISIPRRLTEIYGADGNVIDYIEPLCANLLSPFRQPVFKWITGYTKLQSDEFLRLAAAILCVPFDSLKQRSKRRNALIRNAVLGLIIAILTAFAGILTKWNMDVTSLNKDLEEQFRQSQINETNALTLLSAQQLAAGDRMSALKSAINALPHDNDDRPYSAEAEYALASALHAYDNGSMEFDRIITQENNIHTLSVSDDGTYLVTVDETGCLFGFDLLTGEQLWSVRMEKEDGYRTADDVLMLEILDRQQSVFYADDDYTYVLSLLTGEIQMDIATADFTANDYYSESDGCSICLSSDESVFTYYPTDVYATTDANTPSTFVIYRTDDLTPIGEITFTSTEAYALLPPMFSPDGKYIAIFACEYFPFQEHKLTTTVVNIETEEVLVNQTINNVYFNRDDVAANVTWLSDSSILLHYLIESSMTEHQMEFYHWTGQEDLTFYNRVSLTVENLDTDCTLLDILATSDYVYYVYSSYVISVGFDDDINDWLSSDLELEYSYDIPTGSLVDCYIAQDDSLVLIYADGETECLSGYSKIPAKSDLPDFTEDISRSVIAPASKTMALVFETDPNSIYTLRPTFSAEHKQLSDILLTENHKTTGQIHVALSPDHTKLIAYDTDTLLRNDYALTVYDTTAFEQVQQLYFPEHENQLHFSGFSSDSSKIYLNQYALDLSTEELSELTGTLYPSTNTLNTTPIIFAHVNWSPTDDTLIWQKEGDPVITTPIPEDIRNKLLKVCEETGPKYTPVYGNSGLIVGRHFDHFLASNTTYYSIYSIYDDRWQLIDNPSPSYGVPMIAVGAVNKWVALSDYDQTLRIYDFDTASVIKEYPMSGVSPEAVMQVQFLHDDRVLLIVEDTGSLTAIDTDDGNVLGRYSLDVRDTQWTYHYDQENPQPIVFQVDPTHNDLYVGSYNGRTGGLRIDLDTWSVLAEIPGLICYIPSNHHIIQFDATYEKLYACPVYSVEDLIAQGKTLLSNQ